MDWLRNHAAGGNRPATPWKGCHDFSDCQRPGPVVLFPGTSAFGAGMSPVGILGHPGRAGPRLEYQRPVLARLSRPRLWAAFALAAPRSAGRTNDPAERADRRTAPGAGHRPAPGRRLLVLPV